MQRVRWSFATIAVLVVGYCVVVLGYAATSPDVRLRFLLVDAGRSTSEPMGLVIQSVAGARFDGESAAEGDTLVSLGGRSTRTFLDFTEQVVALRSRTFGFAGRDIGATNLRNDPSGHRWVHIRFRRAGPSGETLSSWIRVQSLPLSEVLLPVVWFVIQFCVFVVAAWAFWNRSGDRPIRLFFLMCVATLGAFVGGYHWWVIAGNPWLNSPFICCAVLVPVVSLHFFLVYPQPASVMLRWRRWILGGLYGVAGLTLVGMLVVLESARWWSSGNLSDDSVAAVLSALGGIRATIHYYLLFAVACFAAQLIALRSSVRTTRHPIEREQVRWIWRAGILATLPLGYSVYLALFDRRAFALGEASAPMFGASLLFAAAYAIGIARFKLMLADQIVSRGMLYYVACSGITLLFAITIVVSCLVALHVNTTLSGEQAFSLAVILMMAVVLLLWFRDRSQQAVDRRFFSEKYQLDKALRRINRAVESVMDRQELADRMLHSCRDVLQVDLAALYLRDGTRSSFQLIGVAGPIERDDVPLQFTAHDDFLARFESESSVQRVTSSMRNGTTPVERALGALHASVVHALDMDGEITGLVALGSKQGTSTFTAEDATFLTAMGQITSVALHCAKVHHDLTRLNEDMQQKVERIADQRRQIETLEMQLERMSQDTPVRRPDEEFHSEAIKGSSPAIKNVLRTVGKVAASGATVLIQGPSGTGKELLAQAIHDNSSRRSGPLVRIHCASLAPSLLESELFGHVRGAFTGAHRDREGRFEMAHGGTLFLDEIGDISLDVQIKLLRVLQERCFEPVGSTRTIHVDVRLITATHQNLESLIEMGRFREDLYYRLKVVAITLPALRERRGDIVELALHFMATAAQREGRQMVRFDDEALKALEAYDWPGNIRELENVVERAVVMAEENRIRVDDLPPEIRGESEPRIEIAREMPTVTDAADSERSRLIQALRDGGGNKAAAARLLEMPRSTFYSKLQKYQINAADFARKPR